MVGGVHSFFFPLKFGQGVLGVDTNIGATYPRMCHWNFLFAFPLLPMNK